MKIWLFSFLVLFALAHFFLWLKNFFLPLPLYIFGGILIAIASNYHSFLTESKNKNH